MTDHPKKYSVIKIIDSTVLGTDDTVKKFYITSRGEFHLLYNNNSQWPTDIHCVEISRGRGPIERLRIFPPFSPNILCTVNTGVTL